jgi:hypothetical protein
MSEHDATTETDASQRPTRMIRARDLAKGDVALYDCAHHESCPVPADQHRSMDGTTKVTHKLTIFDAETHGDKTSVIYVSELGEQGGHSFVDWFVVRVYADTPARAGQQ